MKLGYWMVAKAVVESFFGLGFLLVPALAVSMFGGDLNAAAAPFVRLAGTLFLASALILWRSRKEPRANPMIRSIIVATVMSNGFALVVTLSACLSGAWNILGWSGVFFNAALFLGFGYFLLN